VPIPGAKGGAGGLEMIGPMMKVLAAFMGLKPNFDLAPRGFVGLEFDDADGVVVKKVLAGGPADKAGIKVGDKIDTVGIRGIDGARDVARALAKTKPGQELKVVVKRGEKEVELTVELGRGL
jgi:serine protease DegS/serine protease DegQ